MRWFLATPWWWLLWHTAPWHRGHVRGEQWGGLHPHRLYICSCGQELLSRQLTGGRSS